MSRDVLEEILSAALQEKAIAKDSLADFAAGLRDRARLILEERLRPLQDRVDTLERENAWRAASIEGLTDEIERLAYELMEVVESMGGAVAAIESGFMQDQIAETAYHWEEAVDSGERVSIPPPTTIADGIRLRTPGERTFAIMQSHLDDVLVVSDDDVLETLRFIIQRMKLVAEPTGAVALAAVMRGLVPERFQRVGVFVTGGNLDPALLSRLWAS